MEVVYYQKYRFSIKKGQIIDIDPFLNAYLYKNLKESRYLHSLSVAKLMYEIALRNKLENPLKYYVCGLLHDVGKYVSKEKTLEIMENNYKYYLNLPFYAYHSFVGAYLVENELKIDDKEFLEAIKIHTTGDEKMSTLAEVLFAADKIDPLRSYDSSEMINLMKEDNVKGFIKVVYETKIFLKDKHNDSNYLSERMYQYYL